MKSTIILSLSLYSFGAVNAFTPVQTTSRSSALSASTEPAPLFIDETRDSVKNYYGNELQTSDDLATNACCTAGAPPKYIQDCINNLHPSTVSRYYGCGLCLPFYDMEGCSVLDLGCGAGRDVYIASQLVGPKGRVVGIDMTTEQLDAAREQKSFHAEKFGFDNTEFHQGYLESLDDIEALEKGSFDVIISNCVINLCTDKPAVLKACYDLLKPGGEMYFSDVYANRRVPQVLQDDPLLWGECLSGALYWNDFENMAIQAGFSDPRLVEDAPITIENSDVRDMVSREGHGAMEFYSATYRLFKMDDLEPACEDYGQAVIYKGTIPRAASGWTLDKGHTFETGKIHPVCGNTWYMLHNAQVKDHFEFVGDFSRHYGIFEGCGSSLPYSKASESGVAPTKGEGGGCC
uniref:Arsenite methyltransferase n=1 Tax=Entomoneis paludosa TaxID=265537 RepID=A0A7S3DU83_9STRA|mmetsp:Transcript_35766/g.74414  ORF Transcript_35766/g.74414 Transcript_35766/m.74414 type:complete len:405 (+) Transcript_35766:156-1370(+)